MDDFQDQQNEQDQRRSGLLDRVNNGVDLYRSGKRALKLGRLASGFLGFGGGGASTAAGGAAAAGAETAAGAAAASGPAGWVIILIVSIIVFLIIFIAFFSDSSPAGAFPEDQSSAQSSQSTQPSNVAPELATDCPIKISSSQITCGSKLNPISGCGHGDADYCSKWPQNCGFSGLNFAMDVSAPAGTPIFLPTVKGNVIRWSYLREERGRSEAIQKYAGTDEKTGEKYYIQFHHTVSGSGNLGLHQSGEVGGRVNTNHVHIQFASGNSEWLDASKYFCAR